MRKGEASLKDCLEKLEEIIEKIEGASTLEDAQGVVIELREVYNAIDGRRDEIDDARSIIEDNIG